MTDSTTEAASRLRYYWPDDAIDAPDPQAWRGMTYEALTTAECDALTRDQLAAAIGGSATLMRDETGALWVFDSGAMAVVSDEEFERRHRERVSEIVTDDPLGPEGCTC
jgi:hypothetical protein